MRSENLVAAGVALRRNRNKDKARTSCGSHLRSACKSLENAGHGYIGCQNSESHGSYHREREHYGYKKRVHVQSTLKSEYEMPLLHNPSSGFYNLPALTLPAINN